MPVACARAVPGNRVAKSTDSVVTADPAHFC